MNCPEHMREKNDPDAEAQKKEREKREEIEHLLAGPFVEEDYLS